jgi:hypothetical protein
MAMTDSGVKREFVSTFSMESELEGSEMTNALLL